MSAKIRADVRYVDHRRDADGWEHDEWSVTLRYRRRRMTVPFRTGTAHGEPTAADALSCLLMDAAGYVNAPHFEDWAAECGYDPDSRKAERVFQQVEAQTEALRRLLGPETFSELVFPPDYADHEDVARRVTVEA